MEKIKTIQVATNQGKEYNIALNSMIKVLAQKQVDMLNDNFRSQTAISKMISCVLNVIKSDGNLDKIYIKNFEEAVKDYRLAEENRLRKIFGDKDYERLFAGDEQ